jgi:aryl-alcohol dehydrogenase-like predicted oxidoreductase
MRYKLFGKSGLRVSEIALGTMTFGTEWGWGADKEESKKIFDAYADAGGNFIDTANRYTEGSSEKMVGEFISADRDHFVLATKYSLQDRLNEVNFSGNHRKNMMRSVEASLKRLQTDHIDLFWLHAWDFMTPVDEILRGFDDLIRAGKVHYIGISDTPAWIVSQANTLAELRGWTAFTGLQVEYSLMQRTPERELLPMAKAFGMAVTPWAPIAGGALSGKYLKGEGGRVPEKSIRRSEGKSKIVLQLLEVAERMGVSPVQLAIRWTMQKEQISIPIVGARKLAQIEDSLGCVNFSIPADELALLDEVSKIEMGFPHDFLKGEEVKKILYGGLRDKIDF